MTFNGSPEISLSVLKSPMCFRLLSMFTNFVAKHIRCIKVGDFGGDLWKIIRSMTISANSFSILTIDQFKVSYMGA